MADESKPPQQKWYHTAPGYLTATAALVGSITAAVTGLSQLGIFHSKSSTPPAPAVAPVPATSTSQRDGSHRGAAEYRVPARTTEPASRTPTRSAPAPAPAPAPTSTRPATTTAPATTTTTTPAATPPAAAPAPAPAPPPAPTPAPAPKTGNIGPGTTLQVASGSRVCSTTSNDGDKFTGTTVAPVSGSNGVTLPVGTQVIMSVVTAKAPVFITAKGVSIDVGGKTIPITGTASGHTEITAGPNQKGFGLGGCIPEGGVMSLRLSDGVSITQP